MVKALLLASLISLNAEDLGSRTYCNASYRSMQYLYSIISVPAVSIINLGTIDSIRYLLYLGRQEKYTFIMSIDNDRDYICIYHKVDS